jgi:predicted ribosome quality control (RQC) complex YloA/Tae2 family protein
MLRITRGEFAHVVTLPALATTPSVAYRVTVMPPTKPLAQPQPSFDSIVLAAIAAECRTLIGGRVQRVLQTGPDSIGITVRGRGSPRMIAFSIHGRRAHVIVTRVAPEIAAGAFAQLLRSRLDGSVLRTVETVPFERVIAFGFDALEGRVVLVLELMGRAANAVLCSADRIVGVMRTADSRGRQLLMQRGYTMPQAPARTPLTATAADFEKPSEESARARVAAWRTVLGTVAGIGPALAWEACLDAGIDPTHPWSNDAAIAVVSSLHTIGERAAAMDFAPQLYRDAQLAAVAYAPFPLKCYEPLAAEPASMSAAVEAVTARLAIAAGHDALRSGLIAAVTAAITRTRRALAAVADDLAAAERADVMRQHGELILAYLPQIAPGAPEVEVPGFEGHPVRIRLDPLRSGVENAQGYFKQYARASAARKKLPERRAGLEAELAFLETVSDAIQHAESDDDLWEVEQDLVAAGLRTRARDRASSQRRGRTAIDRRRRLSKTDEAGRRFDLAEWRVLVGRSARENDYLTFEVAGPDDLWLHARGMPGAHVIVTGSRTTPPESTITAAAAIAAFYSAGRESAKVAVDVTARRHVRRARGGRPGQVHYTNERTLVVTPARPAPR